MQPLVVVDCGSGHTELLVITSDKDGNFIEEKRRLGDVRNGGIIDSVVAEGRDEEFLKMIENNLKEGERLLMIGCTGGMRKALRENIVTPDMIHRITTSVTNKWPTCDFKVLTGLEEARYELLAVQTVFSPLHKPSSKTLGYVSGGGATCQVASHVDDVESFHCSTLEVTSLFHNHSCPNEWIQFVENKFLNNISHLSDSPRNGLFMGITMHATAAVAAGIGSAIVSRDIAMESLSTLVQHVLTDPVDQWVKTIQNRCKTAHPRWLIDTHTRAPLIAASAMRLICILKTAFHNDAEFYFSRSHDDLHADWSLGVAVEEQNKSN